MQPKNKISINQPWDPREGNDNLNNVNDALIYIWDN